MKKDKNIVWLFLTFLSFNFCNAAHGPLNHLVPADSFGRLYSDVKYITTSKLNIDADNEGYLLQFIKYPSFDLVSSTVVIENYKKNEYRPLNPGADRYFRSVFPAVDTIRCARPWSLVWD